MPKQFNGKKVIASAGGNSTNLFQTFKNLIQGGALGSVTGQESFSDLKNVLYSVSGVEGFNAGEGLKGLTEANSAAFIAAATRNSSPLSQADVQRGEEFVKSVNGLEGFSQQNHPGSEVELRAANMALNSKGQLQNASAEALFPTHTIAYQEEGIELKVRAAGIGSYVYGADAWTAASELRPIFSLLRTGEVFKHNLLRLFPVYDENADTKELFVDEAKVAPGVSDYPASDAYGRTNHETQMLRIPVTVNNYLALCQAPDQRAWTSTDEVESNSLTLERLMLEFKLDGTDSVAFVDTTGMSNVSFGPTSNGQSSDDRALNLTVRNISVKALLDDEGNPVGEELFKDAIAAGYEPVLTFTVNGNYQRQTNELSLLAGQVSISGLRTKAGNTVTRATATDEQLDILASLTEGKVSGAAIYAGVSNTSRGNFGYRIEVYDAIKHLHVRNGSPISVKYPVDSSDVNQSSLDYAIDQMAVALNSYRSRAAIDAANTHIDYITSINGAPVVANAQGSNVLAGQHFVSATAVRRELDLKEAVSTVDTAGVFEAVSAAVTNEISDIIAALRNNSGLASISEYGQVEATEWTVVAHSNIARFIMRQGDARTLGLDLPAEVVATNLDSEVGKIIIVPKASSGQEIDPIAGIGVCVSKENVVVKGDVQRDQQHYGVMMTMPSFKHHALNPVVGTLTIKDAEKFLTNETMLAGLVTQRITETDPKP